MHELSLCRGLLKQLQTILQTHPDNSIQRVALQIGPLSGVEPELLQQAFVVARQHSPFQATELDIEMMPVRIHCQDCGSEAEANINNLTCPCCHTTRTQLISGDEMLLHHVELNTPPLSPHPNQGDDYV